MADEFGEGVGYFHKCIVGGEMCYVWSVLSIDENAQGAAMVSVWRYFEGKLHDGGDVFAVGGGYCVYFSWAKLMLKKIFLKNLRK